MYKSGRIAGRSPLAACGERYGEGLGAFRAAKRSDGVRIMGRAGAFQPTARPATPSPTMLSSNIPESARSRASRLKSRAPSRSEKSQSPSSTRLWEGNTAALAGALISAATKVMDRAATAISKRRRMAEEIIGETPLDMPKRHGEHLSGKIASTLCAGARSERRGF
jgi:hypothetical protein